MTTLSGQIDLSLDDSKAASALDRFSKKIETQTKNIANAMQSTQVSIDQLALSLKKATGNFAIADKITQKVALTKEEYGKVRKAIQDATREQEKFATATERVAKAAKQVKETVNSTKNTSQVGAGGGGAGGIKSFLGTMGFGGGGGWGGSLLRNVMGGLGVGAGMYGVVNVAKQVTESVQLANAYDRMEVSARKLAGSQESLNALLQAYSEASGGAVSDAVALENVVRLQATGFANSAKELERFVRGARGASIALGKPQDFIVQETQLAVSNTSVKRLDQIGLGIEEVNKRVNELRSSNNNLTREMAFQEAVIGLLNEKYGGLTDTVEGQTTGIEKLSKAWDDAGLTMGQVAQGPVNRLSAALALMIDVGMAKLQLWIDEWQVYADIIEQANRKAREHTRVTYGGMNRFGASALEQRPSPGAIFSPSSIPTVRDRGRFSEEETTLIMEWSAARDDIERRTNAQLLDEYRSYRNQYRQVTEQYQTTILREEEDFNRNRERQAADTAREIAKVHEDAAQRELKAAEDLARNMERMDRDFARQQAISERDLNRSIEQGQKDHARQVRQMEEDHGIRIEEAREDSLERLGEMQAQYDEKIAEAREDSTNRITKMEDDFTKNRELAAKKHQMSLEESAAMLDAKSIFFEERRFEAEQEEAQKAHAEAIEEEKQRLIDFETEANEDHQKAINKEKERFAEFEEEANAAHQKALQRAAEDLTERETQERAAHEQRRQDALEILEQQRQDMIAADAQRLEDAAQADADRLEDINEAITAQQTAEDEDRRIRLERMASDHNKQLSEMTRVHNERIAQIGEQGAAEREALDTEFEKRLAALGTEVNGYAQEYEKLKNIAIEQFDAFLIHVNEELFKKTTGQPVPPNKNQSKIDELKALRSSSQARADAIAAKGDYGPEYQQAMGEVNFYTGEINRLTREGTVEPAENKARASMMMGETNPVAMAGGLGGVGMSIIIASGAIQISGLTAGTANAVAEDFKVKLMQVLKEVTR